MEGGLTVLDCIEDLDFLTQILMLVHSCVLLTLLS